MSRDWRPVWIVSVLLMVCLGVVSWDISQRWSDASDALKAATLAREASHKVIEFERNVKWRDTDSFAAEFLSQKQDSMRASVKSDVESLAKLVSKWPNDKRDRIEPLITELSQAWNDSLNLATAIEKLESIEHICSSETNALHQECRAAQSNAFYGLIVGYVIVLFFLTRGYQRSEKKLVEGLRSIDQSDRKAARRQALQIQATRIISGANNPLQAVESLIHAIAESEEIDLAHVLVVNAESGLAKSSGSWSGTRSDEFSGFRRTIEAAKIRTGEGTPGRALAENSTIWTEDVEVEDNSLRFRTSPEHVAKSCVAVPVTAFGSVVAILEFFACEKWPIDRSMLAVLESLATHAGMLFEFDSQRSQAENQAEELSSQRTQLEELAESLDEKEAHLRALTSQVTVREKQLSIAENELDGAKEYAGRAKSLFEVAARRFEELFNGIPVACFTTDLDGIVYEWNRAAEELWRHPAYTTLQRDVFELLCNDENREAMKEMMKVVATGEAVQHVEMAMQSADGNVIHLVAAVFPLSTIDGRMTGAVWSMTEITERKQVEDQIRTSEGRLRALLAAMQSGVMLLSPQGVVELSNPRMAEMLGYDPFSDGASGKPLQLPAIGEAGRAISPRNSPILRAAKKGESFHDHTMGIRHPNGKLIWLRANVAPVLDACGKPNGAVASFVDITKQREDEQRIRESMQKIRDYSEEMERQSAELALVNHQLEQLATLDGLTGLKNHRSFQEFFEQQFQESKRHGSQLSLILLDVDQFKKFNDEFGHPAGDDVLRNVANRLRAVARTSDFVARYGGEEFVIVLPHTSANEAIEASERMRLAIADAEWEHRAITISLGVATFKKKMSERSELISEADAAMYASKQNGRNKTTHIRELRRRAA